MAWVSESVLGSVPVWALELELASALELVLGWASELETALVSVWV